MDSSVEITKLCQSWWDKVSESAKSSQRACAEQFLGLLGWKDPVPLAMPLKVGTDSTLSFVLRTETQSGLSVHFLMPGLLKPPSSAVDKGLDFCHATRTIVDFSRRLNLRYAFITDLLRSYLYDIETDELILYSDTAEQFSQEFPEVLSHSSVRKGALDEVRRPPRSYAARQLREWIYRWRTTLMDDGELREETVLVCMDRLLVLRYLFDHDILTRTGWRLQKRFTEVIASALDPSLSGCGKALNRLFYDMWFDWKGGLFEPLPELDRLIEEDAVTGPLLTEFALLSKNKFTIATILESFNFGDAAEKARVRLVPEPDEDRSRYLAKRVLDTVDETSIEVDLLDEGYRSIFYWFDRLLDVYNRVGAEFDSTTYGQTMSPDAMDLFTWSEMDASRPGALKDVYQHAVERGLRILYASERQQRTARLLLYLHIIAHYEQSKLRFVEFPRVEAALHRRPSFAAADKRHMFRQAPADAGEWDVV